MGIALDAKIYDTAEVFGFLSYKGTKNARWYIIFTLRSVRGVLETNN